jgi:ribosomal protein L11 methyltransferase
MNYTEVNFKTSGEQADILVALLDDIGYEMFEEYDGGLKAYLPAKNFNRVELDEALKSMEVLQGIPYEVNAIEDKNWNEEWERNYAPVLLDKKIYVRTSFHPSKEKVEYEILIDPKMSFGTGHHDTTSLMLQQMLNIEFDGRTVLDMGCGSGILSIFASMRGAESVEAIDIDEWAFRNSEENCAANRVSNVRVIQGDATAISGRAYDIVLANINRNIILHDLEIYVTKLVPGGHLLVSGFLQEDETIINEAASRFNLKGVSTRRSGNWSSIHYKKSN